MNNFVTYKTPNIVTVVKSKIPRWAGHVAWIWATTKVYGILAEGLWKRPPGRPRRCDRNIKEHKTNS
jgi:hypothetical protein